MGKHLYNFFYAVVFAGVLGILQGCASDQAQETVAPVIPSFSGSDEVTSTLVRHFEQWYATSYRSGGMDKNGVDCSGFVQLTYNRLFGLQLPRTTGTLAHSGSRISVSNLQPGDLVFFKTGPTANHVGIYLENKTFMHASSTRGVMLSSLNETYWKKHFWQARRIFN